MIGQLERVPLREVWQNEPHFTRWLQENIDAAFRSTINGGIRRGVIVYEGTLIWRED